MAEMNKPLRRVFVDFNARDDDDRLGTRLSRLESPVSVGEQVIVYEPGDIRARARVAKVEPDRNLVYFDVDWDSIEADEGMPTGPSPQRA